jgi:hypothetical protein
LTRQRNPQSLHPTKTLRPNKNAAPAAAARANARRATN